MFRSWNTQPQRKPWRSPEACVLRGTCERAIWRNRSSGRAVPLFKIQSEVLRLLAAHRDPESYVGGATPLNRDAPRFSLVIDVFHDRQERVVEAALNDAGVLEGAGYKVAWLRPLPMIYT